MKLITCLTMICAAGFLIGCSEELKLVDPAPNFSDVSKRPPIEKPATVDYLVANDLKMAQWVEYQASACDEYGCIGDDQGPR